MVPGSAEGAELAGTGAYLVESHLVDFLGRVALLPGVQFVAQLLGHLLHHVVPQLHIIYFCPRVLIVLGELGQVESQVLAELMEDPVGAGEAGEGPSPQWGSEKGRRWLRQLGMGLADGREAAGG